MCLLVDELGKLSAIISRPSLLLATFVTAITKNRFGCIASLGDILGKMTLTNPATERGDVGVVGSNCARRPTQASEIPYVLAEMA